MTTRAARRAAIAAAAEHAAIDADALAHRIAALDDLPPGLAAQHGEAVEKAARALCDAAIALQGRTEALRLFFFDEPGARTRRAALQQSGSGAPAPA
jgi:hypothetical protein